MANTSKLRLTAVSRTHSGCLRGYNQDAVHLGKHVLAVADGMGGHAHGEVASAVAVQVLAELETAIENEKSGELEKFGGVEKSGGLVKSGGFGKSGGLGKFGGLEESGRVGQTGRLGKSGELEKSGEIDRTAALGSVVGEVQRRLDDLAVCDSGLYGMGTTITALLWTGEMLVGAHIGDSRAYRWRAGELQQITQDHTLVQSLLDSGRITAAEAENYPRRNMLARAVQTGSVAEPDVFAQRARAGDRYLICSDGLTAVLTAETIADVLADVVIPDDAVDQLIDLALRGGAPDNVSVVLADVAEVPRSGLRKYFLRHSR